MNLDRLLVVCVYAALLATALAWVMILTDNALVGLIAGAFCGKILVDRVSLELEAQERDSAGPS